MGWGCGLAGSWGGSGLVARGGSGWARGEVVWPGGGVGYGWKLEVGRGRMGGHKKQISGDLTREQSEPSRLELSGAKRRVKPDRSASIQYL